jgi:tryptophan synthase alpha chain
MQEYIEEYKPIFDRYGIYNIFLITPQTSEHRIREIEKHSSGFIYMVSSASITGAKKDITPEQTAYFERVKAMKLRIPTLIGFGISDHSTFANACQYANGAIIGSAFINLLSRSESSATEIIKFVQEIKG